MIGINEDRLWKRLMEMSQVGGTANGGVCRVTLTEEDKQGRDLFIEWCKQAGCSIEIDQMGNIFAKRAGKDNSLLPVMVGSHLDSQPTGGKYDGVLGVLAGLEVIETLNDLEIITEHPIELVSWTNEEGARFSPAMISSGVFAKEFSLEYAYSRKDKDGLLLGQELEKIGYKGSVPVGNRPYKATFELHIEQGPILEAEQKSVGIVTGVQGIRWYDLTFQGQETHAGPSPMGYRKDPVKEMLPLLTRIYDFEEEFGKHARITIGNLVASPGVRNTVPGELNVTLDLRHPDTDTLTAMDLALKKLISNFNKTKKVQVELDQIWYSEPIRFDDKCVSAVRDAVAKLDYPAMELVSGAGHDSVYISKVSPTSMIFIPCEKGLSHNEKENIEKKDAFQGTNVLLHAVLELARE
ncbi:Zn-dependent hydrolase [Lutimonas saemankumensis]|uniref:Zn-dependent hydrolase n=1 Tax=Lutimonas saemankumensis TaxID=483016 RepID=UPI001CD287AE|nr:Zn-dependent hydrolase [Lutimonas saemankumensis]MCA0933647.1 Zn-dependent hydrolase [Lutimonas saemankumensis]